MHLNDILENSSIREISLKTMISEENVQYLVDMNFEAIKKVKTLGFISIIEREYGISLAEMRDEAIVFYLKNREGRNYYAHKPIETEEKKGKSKFLLVILLAGLISASWYFFTQFDKKHLHELIPFIGEDTFENFMSDKNSTEEVTSISALSIAHIEKVKENNSETIESDKAKEKIQKEDLPQTEASLKVIVSKLKLEVGKIETKEINKTISKEDANISLKVVDNPVTKEHKKMVSILPSSRLWFGIIDIDTKQRDHFSIAQPYSLDVTTQSWLVATSSASFGLKQGDAESKDFSDTKEHYFKISKEAITELTKAEYVEQGGWSQW